MNIYKFQLIFILLFSIFLINPAYAQVEDDEYEQLLIDEKKLENPVYKPVIGVGGGGLTFFGDVYDNYRNPVISRLATNIDISMKMSKFIKLTFFVILGKLTGNEHLLIEDDIYRNLNFQTDILNGGVNISYNFEHLLKEGRIVTPFISAGIESFNFNSKADLKDAQGNYYYYWTDGSIRNVPENSDQQSIILQRDYNYETDLRGMDNDGLKVYSQSAFAIPIDVGIDFTISDKLSLRLGNSFHFTFTDLIDDISSEGQGIRKENKKGNDRFMYSYVSLHLDLFSKVKETVQLQFAVIDFSEMDFEDEDYDYVLDFVDECPGTPYGVLVDTLGCPFDSDNDGIPDHIDKEPNTPEEMIFVDSDGVGIKEDKILALLSDTVACSHNEIFATYPSMHEGPKTFRTLFIEIPDKFIPFDLNNDDNISIEELLNAIDKFFDFGSNLTLDDLYDLNDFFFEQ